MMNNPNKWYSVPNVQADSISCVKWSASAPDILASGAWDGEIRVWQVATNPSANEDMNRFHANPVLALKHGAPVLCLAINKENRLFSGGCDGMAKAAQLAPNTHEMTPVGKHDAPIKFIHYIENANILMTGSWDKTIKYWDFRQAGPTGTIQLPERVYCGDVKGNLAVIGCANRSVVTINLSNPTQIFKQEESQLKMQTRCVECFSDQGGYAIGSIEGRVGIQDFRNSKETFAYKCHRENVQSTTQIYAVNCIKFHPTIGTFATGGSDGKICFWDKEVRQRLHVFDVKMSQQVVDMAFSSDGNILAMVDSYDWSKGPAGYNRSMPNHIYLTNPSNSIKRKK